MAKTGGVLFITGVKELDAKLRKMNFRMQGRILRDAMREAMKPVLGEAQNTIPVDTGYTRRRLRIKTGKPRRDGARIVRVGIFGPASKGRGKEAFPTGRAIEFGTKHSEALFILRKALSGNETGVLFTLRNLVRAGVRSAVL